MNKKIIAGYAIGPIGAGIISMLTLPILTWMFNTEDIGRISMLQVTISFVVLLFSLGLDQAYVREFHESSNKYLLLKNVITPSIAAIIFVVVPIFIYDSTLISTWIYDIPSTYLSAITIICIISALCTRFLSLILRMQDKSLAYSMSQLLSKILFLIIITTIYWLGTDRNIYSLIQAHVASFLIALIVFAWNTRKDWKLAIKENLSISYISPLIHFGFPLVFAGLAAWGMRFTDRLFLRHYSSFSELGIYSVAMSIGAVVTLFSSIFNTIWAPMVYKWLSDANSGSAKNVVHKKIEEVLEYLLAAVYFFVVLSGLFSWIIPYILPEEYENVKYLVSVCILGSLFYTLSEVTGIGIAISRKTKLSMICSLFAVIVSIVLNFLLVPHYGAKGATIATSFAFLFFLVTKTELSKIVWFKHDFMRFYLIISLLTIISLLSLILSNPYFYFAWLLTFFIGIILFKKVISNCFRFIFKNSHL